MELKIKTGDPLDILRSTKEVFEGARFVSLSDKNLEASAELIKKHRGELNTETMGYSFVGNFEDDLQLVFLENAVNFCFWPDQGEPKWQVEGPNGGVSSGGWFGLKASFERGVKEGVPILDANYLSDLSLDDGTKFFRGINDTKIPLLEERVQNLREAGKVLMSKFQGKFVNLFNGTNDDAIQVTRTVIENFPSFRDVSHPVGKNVFFYKRAQILSQDINYILPKGRKLKKLNQLTAFADYKLPQLLRANGVLEYKPDLAEKIDNYVQIPHDSREEIEIRASTIWAVELLKDYLHGMSSADIDNTIWLMSQNQDNLKPYHRSRTIFY